MTTDANVQLKTRARALAASSGLTFDEALVLLRAQVGADLEADVRAAPVRPRIGVNTRGGMGVIGRTRGTASGTPVAKSEGIVLP